MHHSHEQSMMCCVMYNRFQLCATAVAKVIFKGRVGSVREYCCPLCKRQADVYDAQTVILVFDCMLVNASLICCISLKLPTVYPTCPWDGDSLVMRNGGQNSKGCGF